MGESLLQELEQFVNPNTFEDVFTNLEFDEFGVEIKPTKYGKHFNTAMDLYESGVDAYTFMTSVV